MRPNFKNIRIEVISHRQQRYETVGDWFFDAGGGLIIRVSDMGNWKYNVLVAMHELVEVLCCREDGVTQGQVDRFDINYERKRKANDDSEPGDDPKAPYRKQHCLATGVERILAAVLGVSWSDYDNAVKAAGEMKGKGI